jgi:23S rRNA pseudouridine1911/1915/1917 synthase
MKLIATKDDIGLRIDVWLARRLPDFSRSRLQSLIKAGHITRAGRPVRPRDAVVADVEVDIEVPPPEPAEPVGENIPLTILYEDADIIVIDKPAGLVVHPAAGHASGTLVNALLHHCKDLTGIGGERRPGIVHRLDKDTSGAMVVAKNEHAMAHLVDQFKNGRVRKEYLAVVQGKPVPAAGTVKTLIGRSSHDRKKMSARPSSGRPAVTHYRVEESWGGMSLLRVRIETGRTHQIRVHMAHIGHPVVGDLQYGRSGRHSTPSPVNRQMLHAETLAFSHPRTGKPLEFKAPLPADVKRLLAELRRMQS